MTIAPLSREFAAPLFRVTLPVPVPGADARLTGPEIPVVPPTPDVMVTSPPVFAPPPAPAERVMSPPTFALDAPAKTETLPALPLVESPAVNVISLPASLPPPTLREIAPPLVAGVPVFIVISPEVPPVPLPVLTVIDPEFPLLAVKILTPPLELNAEIALPEAICTLPPVVPAELVWDPAVRDISAPVLKPLLAPTLKAIDPACPLLELPVYINISPESRYAGPDERRRTPDIVFLTSD